jgi:hypothetical protein
MNGIAELSHRGMGRSILTLKRVYSQPAKSLAPRSLHTGVASSRAFVCRALEQPKPRQGVYVFRESLGRNVANPPSCCPYHRRTIKKRMRVGRFRDLLSCHRYRCRHPLHRPRRLAVPGGPILSLRHLLRSCGPPLPPCPGRNRILVRVLAISKNLTLFPL